MKLHMLSVFFTVFFVLANSAISQDCILPYAGMQITEDTIFCKQEYVLEQGISIVEPGITLDCNSAIIKGKGLGYGIYLHGMDHVSVVRCDLSNFEAGIYLESSNQNIISGNKAHKNRFGIVLYDAQNNSLIDNVLQENSRSNSITVSPSKPFTEIAENPEVAEIPKHTPSQVYEQAIRLKNPAFNESQISEDLELVFNRYFNLTQQNVELRRSYYFNSTNNSTKIILRLIPKKTVENLTIYEDIPKCMAAFVQEIAFDQGNYEIIESDPLITWHFDSLTEQQLITYTVLKQLDDDCKDLLLSFGIATGFPKAIALEERPSIPFVLIGLVAVFFILIVVFIFNRLRE